MQVMPVAGGVPWRAGCRGGRGAVRRVEPNLTRIRVRISRDRVRRQLLGRKAKRDQRPVNIKEQQRTPPLITCHGDSVSGQGLVVVAVFRF
jgi:hypothetical protein